ncbi:hypothetical protein SASPL_119062 [Salvia splendens]|uniref:DUF7054 domain-containing protein n=1 Tax=Salvia splendens TaxID=180675 RepID=A0A8X8XXW1_SALSN|nr:hypothetical protein SASPL_119062 [Salvia splendens]
MSSPKKHRKLGSHDKSRKEGEVVARSKRRLPRGGDFAEAGEVTKLLLHVTIQRSLGAVRVVMPPGATAEDQIVAALRQYEKEARLPLARLYVIGVDERDRGRLCYNRELKAEYASAELKAAEMRAAVMWEDENAADFAAAA